ncbi:phage protein U [Volucribacter psittacicida]|uniref:Phage protein U n=1 Tax=Volucribacter psittacicida TaxID=203482 RepID=A0A4R1FQY7_9PAST|nr:phage tail protein [Volucribacter psittacicida]TCJ95964.1 phage protein U [Volucribacter psittacicida]
MYCLLGNIAFEPIDLTEFSETHGANFAEHQVLEGKPRLQAMGEQLIELSFALRLHYKIGGVESRYQALLKAQSQQQALALIWGRGKYKGNFVITSITSTTLYTDARGNALCRELKIQLKEFVGDPQQSLLGEALNLGGKSLLGSILPESVTNALSEVKSAVNKGVEIYQQGKRLVNEAQNTLAIAKQMVNDPSLALAYLPSALNSLGGALGGFGEVTGMGGIFEGIAEVLPAVSGFVQEVGEIYSDVSQVYQEVNQVVSSAKQDWHRLFDSTETHFNQINHRFEVIAPKVAEMTAWIVIRADEEDDDTTNLT